MKALDQVIFISLFSIFIHFHGFSQGKEVSASGGFEYCKRVTIALGYISNDTMFDITKKKVITKRFRTLGSGLLTYVKSDTLIQDVIITARHVTDAILKLKLNEIYVRPSWADTLSTSVYFGLPIPLFERNGVPNIFLHPIVNIDLVGLFIPKPYCTKFYLDKFQESGHELFPINNISTPSLGDQIWINGYPDHIENDFQNRFSYCIGTFKPGYVTWIPDSKMKNTDLNHISLIESNATHGNSGGPVFSIRNQTVILVGILVAGFQEQVELYSQNSTIPLRDSVGGYYYSNTRSGVSIIEKAENILTLLAIIKSELEKRLKNKG